jgi:hypothetical protein
MADAIDRINWRSPLKAIAILAAGRSTTTPDDGTGNPHRYQYMPGPKSFP